MAENIEVIHLGEDGDLWLVTGTTDAHSAEDAVRMHERRFQADMEIEDELQIKHHRDLVWRYGGLKPSRFYDDELLTFEESFKKYAHENRRVFPFNGYLVTL